MSGAGRRDTKGCFRSTTLTCSRRSAGKTASRGFPAAFVLTEGGVIAGHSCARPAADEKMPGWGEVHTLYVLPEYWGRGFGTALLDNSVRWLKNQGFDRIYLWALDGNVRARRLYEKYGFTPTADALPVPGRKR